MDGLPLHCPEAERGVFGCCLLDITKVAVAVKAGVTRGSFYDIRRKGNAAAKEGLDRISGSGVFARDPDSVLTFTKHEEDGAFTVEPTLRNLAPVDPFVVRWDYPLFVRADGLDPAKLKQNGGRPATSESDVLEILGSERLDSDEWQARCVDSGISRTVFYRLRKKLETAQKVQQSVVDKKWEKIQAQSKNYQPYKDPE